MIHVQSSEIIIIFIFYGHLRVHVYRTCRNANLWLRNISGTTIFILMAVGNYSIHILFIVYTLQVTVDSDE
jgi:hypothetical protein